MRIFMTRIIDPLRAVRMTLVDVSGVGNLLAVRKYVYVPC